MTRSESSNKKSTMAMWKRDDVDTLQGRYFILSMSSKGGTGKSTVAANIAYELARRGVDVGLVGVDVDSDNIPGMLGIEEKSYVDVEDMFIPIVKDGVKVISIEVLLKKKTVMSKRGKEIATIISDLIRWTRWDNTNVIVLDMPAGVSEEVRAVIGVVGRKRIIGSAIVCTPNTYEDLERTLRLCVVKAIPLSGVVINMSGAVESDGTPVNLKDGTQYFPFGDGKAVEDILKKNNVPLIGTLPLINGHNGFLLPDFALGPIRAICDGSLAFLGDNSLKIVVHTSESAQDV